MKEHLLRLAFYVVMISMSAFLVKQCGSPLDEQSPPRRSPTVVDGGPSEGRLVADGRHHQRRWMNPLHVVHSVQRSSNTRRLATLASLRMGRCARLNCYSRTAQGEAPRRIALTRTIMKV